MSARKKQDEEKVQLPTIKLVKLDKAYKLAMQWMDDMSGTWKDDVPEVELEGRPAKLGLGAEINRRNEYRQADNEDTWKLRAMLDQQKRKYEESDEKNAPVSDEEGEEDDESKSRCNAFAKKRPTVPVLGLKKKEEIVLQFS